jgi:hypothetical protein
MEPAPISGYQRKVKHINQEQEKPFLGVKADIKNIKRNSTHKFLALKDNHQATMTLKAIHWSEKFVLSLSEHVAQHQKSQCLKEGLIFQ